MAVGVWRCKVASLISKIADLSRTIAVLNTTIAALISKIEALTSELPVLNTIVAGLNRKVVVQRGTVASWNRSDRA